MPSYYQCGNKNCRKLFKYKELRTTVKNIDGVKVRTKRCPFCGSDGYTALDKRTLDYFARMDVYRSEKMC